MKAPTTFDIYLLRGEDGVFDAQGLLETLSQSPIRSSADDPTRYVYSNPDTGVFFQVLLAPEVLASWGRDARAEEETPTDELTEEEDPGEEDPGEEDSREEDPGADDAEDAAPLEIPPVTLAVPFGTPSFFGTEAAVLAEKMAHAARLRIEHSSFAPDPAEGPAGSGKTRNDALVESWMSSNRAAVSASRHPGSLEEWSLDRAQYWLAYGSSCKALDAELGEEGVHVPRLQAARYQGKLVSLIPWEEGMPSVFPRTDLVLIRRERDRKGFLFTRRVTEEGLVSGDKIWDILAPSSEVREAPARLLIFREARNPPQQVAAQLEMLPLESVDNAKRTVLLGVVDFEISEGGEAAK